MRIRPSLFWKIFSAFLLTNIAVMLAATFVAIQLNESAHVRERHSERVSQIAEWIIDEYEEHGQVADNALRQPPPYLRQAARFLRRQNWEIYDVSNTLIFQNATARDSPNRQLRLEIVSEAGQPYTIVTEAPRIPRILTDALKRLHFWQLGFILLASCLISGGLSWLIARPLKRLGGYVKDFGHGQRAIVMQHKLLQRGDEIGTLAREFDAMAAQVRAHIQQQKQLLHDVSHELRAPLSRLQAAAALIEQKAGPSTTVARVHRECERINHLIQQILDYARLEQRQNTPEFFDLISLVRERIDDTQFEHPDRSIRFDTDQESVTVNGYRETLARALDNTLRNACLHTKPHTPIDVLVETDAKHVAIKIRDHGLGINDNEREALLKPFYRAGEQMQTEGFGLGLSIATRAVHKQGGSIQLDNHPQGGLQVTIRLVLE